MEEIKVFNFIELSGEIKRAVVNKYPGAVMSVSDEFIDTTWKQRIYVLTQVLSDYGMDFSVNVTIIESKVELRTRYSNKDNMTGEERKNLLTDIVRSARRVGFHYIEELQEAASKYKPGFVPAFFAEFLSGLAREAWTWLIRMYDDKEYAIDYIVGDVDDSRFAPKEMYFTGMGFDADGKRICMNDF